LLAWVQALRFSHILRGFVVYIAIFLVPIA
jgi:hypothetical protein